MEKIARNFGSNSFQLAAVQTDSPHREPGYDWLLWVGRGAMQWSGHVSWEMKCDNGADDAWKKRHLSMSDPGTRGPEQDG